MKDKLWILALLVCIVCAAYLAHMSYVNYQQQKQWELYIDKTPIVESDIDGVFTGYNVDIQLVSGANSFGYFLVNVSKDGISDEREVRNKGELNQFKRDFDRWLAHGS